ncbi:A disintegrin and metalloproteinase with thrombospondin motifs 7 isoform X2 [Agrilus planipennis]|nr:A disintegrin and metalloproteinase with thrombospondin motifs 7 isoform X2 [Agrilus planipennis]
MIQTNEEKYWIEPSHHHDREIRPGHKHLVFKRSAVKHPHNKKRWKKKHKHSKNCGTREPKKTAEVEWLRQVGKLTVQEKRSGNAKKKTTKKPDYQKRKMKKYKQQQLLNRTKRSVSKPRYVEALLVADQSMVDFHENEDIETYMLTIMNMVSSVYLDPTIGNLIKVVVVKIILLDENDTDPPLNILVNADVTLRNFCKWQKSLNPHDEKDPYHHDVAILITRKDICARANHPCSTLGVAHIGGMCKQEKSCSVNEDNGITLAHTIAHEMGHNFGMFHDTEKIGCKGKDGNRLHVMTPSFEVDTVGVSWSKCSRRDVTTFLDKGLGECLQDEPKELKDYRYPKLPAGAMYNADFQCRLQFGTEVKVCSSPSEICSQLWCEVNNTCTSQLRPAAPGTHCGKHKWCQDQKCVPVVDPPVAIDGGWGEWSSWSECSRTCGSGVSIMHRKCDHPKPSGGGKYCIGERRRYKMCNIEPCPVDQPSFRALQCTSYNNHTYNGKKYTWLPYFDQDEPCELYCSDLNDTIIVPWGEHALDGTPCNVGTRDVCISGICRKVGCDWVVDSAAQEDACGICRGDGTKCNTIEGIFTKQSLEADYKEVVTVPADARNIYVEEMNQTENYIGIGSVTSKKFYLNGKRHITLAGEYTVAGAQALYERDNEWEKIRIPGPIKEPIVIYVIFKGKTPNPGVKYQYTISKREPKTLKYSWVLSEWSQCSVTCGGGTQHRKPLCQEMITGSSIPTSIVDETWCDPAEKPEKLMRACNIEICPFHWWTGPWHPCPVTCFSKGEKVMRRRDIMCIEGKEMLQPDQFCEQSTRPHEYEPCNSLPLCLEDR